ncbi:MAG TPA: tetratricopeptide repeat protein [Chitinophagales bacterium]|nr:tetratricopeptide repeat protein [Chitinophagales bacterium]
MLLSKFRFFLLVCFAFQSCYQSSSEKLIGLAINCKSDSEAVSLLNRAIEIDSSNPTLFLNRAKRKFAMKDLAGAKKDCEKVISLKPDYPQAYASLGSVYVQLKNHNLAIENFNQALKIDSNDFASLFLRGESYYNLDSNRQAINDIDKGLLKSNDNLDSLVLRARLVALFTRVGAEMNLNIYDGTLNDINFLISKEPYYNVYFIQRGAYYCHFGDYTNALKDFSKAITLDSTNNTAYFTRGCIYHYTANDLKACEDWEIAKNMGSKDAEEMINKYCK